MPRSNLPKGVHRVRRKVVSSVRYHFYVWRGGPKFWEGTEPNPKVYPCLFTVWPADQSCRISDDSFDRRFSLQRVFAHRTRLRSGVAKRKYLRGLMVGKKLCPMTVLTVRMVTCLRSDMM